MLRRHSRRDRRLNTCHRHVFLTPRRIATPVCGLVRNDRIVLSAKIKSAFVSSRDKGAIKRPLRYHSRCRARRPLSPTIRGCGVITARFRPCLLFGFSRMLRGDIRAMPASALHRNGGSLCVRLWRCVSPSSRLCHVYHEISVNITTFSPFVNGIFTKSKEKSGIFQMIPNIVRMPIRPMAV